MKPVTGVARRTLDAIRDSLISGVPPTARTTQRSLAALRDIGEREGAAAARDAAARLRTVALSQAAGKLAGDGRASPPGSRACTAAELRAVHKGWLATFNRRVA